jgi:hypothetical protein
MTEINDYCRVYVWLEARVETVIAFFDLFEIVATIKYSSNATLHILWFITIRNVSTQSAVSSSLLWWRLPKADVQLRDTVTL